MERLKLAAERGRDQQRFVLELRKVADGLRAEAQRAARGDDAQVKEIGKKRGVLSNPRPYKEEVRLVERRGVSGIWGLEEVLSNEFSF